MTGSWPLIYLPSSNRSPDCHIIGSWDNEFAIWADGNTTHTVRVPFELCFHLASLNVPNPEDYVNINELNISIMRLIEYNAIYRSVFWSQSFIPPLIHVKDKRQRHGHHSCKSKHVSHRIVVSSDPEAMNFPSPLKTAVFTHAECPSSLAFSFPGSMSHSLHDKQDVTISTQSIILKNILTWWRYRGWTNRASKYSLNGTIVGTWRNDLSRRIKCHPFYLLCCLLFNRMTTSTYKPNCMNPCHTFICLIYP